MLSNMSLEEVKTPKHYWAWPEFSNKRDEHLEQTNLHLLPQEGKSQPTQAISWLASSLILGTAAS